MPKIDIDTGESLLEKIMAHFGWYKTKMVEFPVSKLEITHHFTLEPQINFTDEEIQNAINQISEHKKRGQEHQEGNGSRKKSETKRSNSPKRTTRSKKERE